MQITSILAIYFLFWVMCAFILLPFGVKTAEEMGVEHVPGQAESAPANFKPRKIVVRATSNGGNPHHVVGAKLRIPMGRC